MRKHDESDRNSTGVAPNSPGVESRATHARTLDTSTHAYCSLNPLPRHSSLPNTLTHCVPRYRRSMEKSHPSVDCLRGAAGDEHRSAFFQLDLHQRLLGVLCCPGSRCVRGGRGAEWRERGGVEGGGVVTKCDCVSVSVYLSFLLFPVPVRVSVPAPISACVSIIAEERRRILNVIFRGKRLQRWAAARPTARHRRWQAGAARGRRASSPT